MKRYVWACNKCGRAGVVEASGDADAHSRTTREHDADALRIESDFERARRACRYFPAFREIKPGEFGQLAEEV